MLNLGEMRERALVLAKGIEEGVATTNAHLETIIGLLAELVANTAKEKK